MPPRRATSRASSSRGATPASTRTTRATRSQTASLDPPRTKVLPQLGLGSSAYGDDGGRAQDTGLADIRQATGFADQLKKKMAESRKRQERAAAGRKRTPTPQFDEQVEDEVIEEEEEEGEEEQDDEAEEEDEEIENDDSEEHTLPEPHRRRGSPSPNQRRSASRRARTPADDTMPSGGIEPHPSIFTEQYEVGLALPARLPWTVPALETLTWDRIARTELYLGIAPRDLYHAALRTAVVAIPLFTVMWFWHPIFVFLCTLFYSLKSIPVPSIRIPVPHLPMPTWNTNYTATKTVVVTVTSTAASTSTTTVLKGRASDEAKLWEELRGLRSDMQSVAERVHTVENTLSSTHRPNFFSPSLGATICPEYTSPTRYIGQNGLNKVWNQMFYRYKAPPPIRALTPWTENGDCWCAADAHQGRLSLGVNLGKEVYPRSLIVEHIPKDSALEIQTAPKRLDIWGRLAYGLAPENVPDEWRDNAKGCESTRPYDKLNSTYVCMGVMNYDIHDRSPVQGRRLTGFNQEPPFQINKAIVRVLENHGKAYTCLYRVRLEGEVKPGQYQNVK